MRPGGFFVSGCSPSPVAAVFPVARRWRASFCLSPVVDGHDGVSVDAWARRLAQVGEVVWGAACAVAYGDGVEVEAVRLLADAR